MNLVGSLRKIAMDLERQIGASSREPDCMTPDHYAALAWVHDRRAKYGKVNPELAARYAELHEQSPRLAFLFNKFLICSLAADFTVSRSPYKIPPSVERLYLKEIRRIADQLDRFELSFYDLGRDEFLKDLAILTHRLIPVGAEFAQPDCGVPRSVLFKGGPSQLLRGLWFFGVRLRGFKPLFSLHLHNLALDEFNPEGLVETYGRLAELLELNPEFKGWFSGSWFLDPQLASISPHLAHLRAVPEANGAAIFFVEADPRGTSGALAKSATRQRLFREGKYLPKIYMRVWPRQAMLEWQRGRAEHTRGGPA